MKITLSLAPFIFFGLSLLSAYASDTTPRNIAYIYGDEEELLELVSDGEPVASDVTHYIMAFLYSETTSAADLQLAFAPYDNTTAIQAPLAKVFKELQDSGAKVMLGFGGASMNSIGFWSNYADDYDTLAQVVSEFVKGTSNGMAWILTGKIAIPPMSKRNSYTTSPLHFVAICLVKMVI